MLKHIKWGGVLSLSILIIILSSCKADVISQEDRIYQFIHCVNSLNYTAAQQQFYTPSSINITDFVSEYFPQTAAQGRPLAIVNYYQTDQNIPNRFTVGIRKNGSAAVINYNFTMKAVYMEFPQSGEHWFIESLSIVNGASHYTLPVP